MLEAERTRVFESWIDEHKAILFKVARVYGATHSDREDLFQEIALQVWHSVEAYRARSFELAEEAIKRGGQASWFNRLRASLNRARAHRAITPPVSTADYASALVRSFDDHLEHVGARGRFEKFVKTVADGLSSEKHQQYCEALETFGKLLGYHASRPKGKAVTDNRWRGTFGQVKEIVTFEAKIEHEDGNTVTPTHMGQAHNQLNRAVVEFSQLGYSVRATIVTHMNQMDSAARSSAGPIRMIEKSAVSALWDHVRALLAAYRQGWSLDGVAARQPAAQTLHAKCPRAGWFAKALDTDEIFVGADGLLKEWPGASSKAPAPVAPRTKRKP